MKEKSVNDVQSKARREAYALLNDAVIHAIESSGDENAYIDAVKRLQRGAVLVSLIDDFGDRAAFSSIAEPTDLETALVAFKETYAAILAGLRGKREKEAAGLRKKGIDARVIPDGGGYGIVVG